MEDATIKINSKLKKRVEKLISKDDMGIEYPSVKNFVDRAVLKQLQEMEKKKK